MTMYPFLTGFWFSTGTSLAVIFCLIHWQRAHSLHASPAWLSTLAMVLIFISPLLGIAYAWYKVSKLHHLRSVRSTRHRCMHGAILGAVIIFAVGTVLLPILLK